MIIIHTYVYNEFCLEFFAAAIIHVGKGKHVQIIGTARNVVVVVIIIIMSVFEKKTNKDDLYGNDWYRYRGQQSQPTF